MASAPPACWSSVAISVLRSTSETHSLPCRIDSGVCHRSLTDSAIVALADLQEDLEAMEKDFMHSSQCCHHCQQQSALPPRSSFKGRLQGHRQLHA